MKFENICASFLMILSACDRSDAEHKLTWDLSDDTSISRVNWPAKEAGEVWYVDGPGTIHIKARGRFEHDVPYWFAQIWRENGRARSVCIMLPPGNVDQVYADAIKIADEWKFDKRQEIEDFLKTRGERILKYEPVLGSGAYDGEQPRGLEIRQSFAGNDKPFYVTLVLGFPQIAPLP